MALNGDILGDEVYNIRKSYSDKTLQQLIDDYGSLDGARLQECKDEMNAIVNHFKTNGTIPAIGFAAPNGPVTGTAHIV
ncbi:MAG: hypothetical protein JSR11_03595 [Bacteroidetes bacterium]|nr:hypothetical protein [Bacteroidota bacterium]